MSFDFGSNDQSASDPTADFLARERSAAGALGGDSDLFSQPSTGAQAEGEKDFAASAAAFPSLDGSDEPISTSANPTAEDGGWGNDDLGFGPSTTANQTATAPVSQQQQSEVSQFENKFPELDDEEEELDMGKGNPSNGYMAPPVQSTMFTNPTSPAPGGGGSSSLPTTTFSYSVNPSTNESDPVAIQQWREKQADNIAARDAAAERKKGEAISKAEEDIDRFYREYNETKEKNIRKNKESEASFLSTHSQSLASGTTWSRVCNLIELQNSQSKTIARTGPGSTDLSRMRETLLSLRREGESAPGAAGY